MDLRAFLYFYLVIIRKHKIFWLYVYKNKFRIEQDTFV